MAGSDFDDFFRMHFEPVARALTLATGSRELAADATQDAFTKAYERWRRVKQMDRPDGWVYVVAMNAVRRRQRATQSARARGCTGTRCDRECDDTAVRTGGDGHIAAAQRGSRPPLLGRPHACRRCRCHGLAVGTVKATLHQALQSLRIEFEETEDED